MKYLTNDEVAERAQKWVQFWRITKYRDKMDSVLQGLNSVDQRRVVLCGQRMSGGLPLKVLPAPQQPGKEGNNGKKDNQRQRTNAAANSAPKAKGKASVGANKRSAGKGGSGRSKGNS